MRTAWLIPSTANPVAKRLVIARGIRGFGDGFVSLLLASYLDGLGFSALEIGAIVAGTLLGSAALTLAVGVFGGRLQPVRILLGAALLMLLTGLGFATVTAFVPLLLVAIAGTLNPTGGDVSVFLPVEQAALTSTVSAEERTSLFARYNLAGAFAGALGALVGGVPAALASANGWERAAVERVGFAGYGLLAIVIALLYVRAELPVVPVRRGGGALRESRSMVLKLAALFSLDSFGGGFVVQSLLALWLFERFDLSVGTAGVIFFCAGLLTALSQLAAPWLAARIGLVRTMAFSHIPANLFLIAAAAAPNASVAIAFLLARMALATMDVPARQSFVMAVVPPEERAAAASITNVPRSLASAAAPLIAGAMLSASSFGWPLIVGGLLKLAYDVLLLRQFGQVEARMR